MISKCIATYRKHISCDKEIIQNLYQSVYRFVPIQDFASKSDIDWNKNIHGIDLQLYKKYNLTDDEINYIESKIKEME